VTTDTQREKRRVILRAAITVQEVERSGIPAPEQLRAVAQG
jgi:hypothetical protein